MTANSNPTRIVPCLWFDGQAEEAARFYISIFPNSRIIGGSQYGEAGHEIHGQEAGTTLTVDFELNGARFTAMNGGPQFKFNEAISFQIECDTQEEIDHYWEKLREGGDPQAQQCGWLKDRFGLSWQVVPRIIGRLMTSKDKEASERVMTALLKMKKLDIAELERAAAGD
jgi:predicted 3-demethylubiquinone-9 3-methyltransferase (glyoxalase superfamily)